MIIRWLKSKLARYFRAPQFGDLEFRKKFKEFIYKEIKKDYIEDCIKERIVYLLKKNSTSRNNHSSLDFRFLEFFERTILRYVSVKQIEWEMVHLDRLRDKRPRGDVQKDFVNDTESFHQQIYATLSAFIKLLTHIAPKKFSSQMPSKSLCKFIDFLKKEVSNIEEEMAVIKRSREYRTRYVDHINQNISHNWYTLEIHNGEIYIVYYSTGSNGKIMDIPEIDGGGFTFKTSLLVESYFVPPHHKDTIIALSNVVLKTLDFLIDYET